MSDLATEYFLAEALAEMDDVLTEFREGAKGADRSSADVFSVYDKYMDDAEKLLEHLHKRGWYMVRR
jgi:hypothetical protein